MELKAFSEVLILTYKFLLPGPKECNQRAEREPTAQKQKWRKTFMEFTLGLLSSPKVSPWVRDPPVC